MERMIGTVSRGVRAPIIREGDDIVKIVTDSILAASNSGKDLRDKDVVAVTEAVVARAQGNYVGVEDIAADVRAKFPSGEFTFTSAERFMSYINPSLNVRRPGQPA